MHNGVSQQTTLQMSHSPNKAQYYDISRNGNRYGGVNGDQRYNNRNITSVKKNVKLFHFH